MIKNIITNDKIIEQFREFFALLGNTSNFANREIKERDMELTITNDNFESCKNGNLPFVVDLWAEWCAPSRMLGPVISELAKEYDGKIVVGKCNIEENEDIPVEYGVRNIPTLLFFKQGKLVDKFVGAGSKAALKEKFDALL